MQLFTLTITPSTSWPLNSTGDQAQLLSNALEQSRAFDLAFGFKCDNSKCSVASASVSADVCDLAVRLDYWLFGSVGSGS